MSVSAVQSYQSTSAASAAAASNATQDVQDRFLTLLVTQLKNQDPMNPMENAELTTQLAQMSTVEGINKLNSSFETLLSGYQASQTLQAASLIDRTVLVDGDLLALGDEGAAARIDLRAAADSVNVRIADANGQLVRVLSLGAQPAGMQDFYWDGTDAAGNALATGEYRYSVDATASGGEVSAQSYALGRVASVALSGGAAQVDIAGIGTRDVSQILQIF